jgi:hypothetical protein
MTCTREPVRLLLESAPVDPFDDTGPRRYRVVAALGTPSKPRHVVALTREHPHAEDALAVFAARVRFAVTSSEVDLAVREHARDLHAHTRPLEAVEVDGDDAFVETAAGRRRLFGRGRS